MTKTSVEVPEVNIESTKVSVEVPEVPEVGLEVPKGKSELRGIRPMLR